MDNRLDFISNIDPVGIEEMITMRKKFMALDADMIAIQLNQSSCGASARALALARTNLEISLQYAIKTLCLVYEIKD